MSHNYNRKSRANPQFQNWKGHCLTHITKLEVKVFQSVHSHNLTSILPFTTDVRVAVNACMVQSQICVFMVNTHMCNNTCSVLSLSTVHCLLKSTSTMSRPGVVKKKRSILPNQQQKWMKRSKWVMEDALVDDQLSLKLYIAFTLCIVFFVTAWLEINVHFPYINLHTDSGFGECPYMTFSHTQTHPIKTAARDRTLFSIFMSQIHTTWDSGNDEKCTQSHVHVCCSFKGKFCWECAVSSFLFCSQYSVGFVLAVTGVFFVISFI